MPLEYMLLLIQLFPILWIKKSTIINKVHMRYPYLFNTQEKLYQLISFINYGGRHLLYLTKTSTKEKTIKKITLRL
jgi:hypothetical protein